MASVGTTVNSAYTPWATTLTIDERDARFALAGYAIPKPGTVMSYKSGVFAGGAISGTTLGDASHGGLRVTVKTTGSSPAVTVNVGNCLIDTPSNGPYLCGLDAAKDVSLATPSSTQRRIDLIVARVYDDRNTAIASTSGDRRFVVQAITGDNTSGTPVVPTATLPANGWIPLAAVQIEANGASMTVTDMRGPGLVARGGKRILYGNDAKITSDAFAEAGAYAGDQRYVVGHPFPNQTYYVSSDAGSAGWRGDGGKLVYTSTPANVGQVYALGQGTVTAVTSVSIPAFGIPVIATPVGRVNFTADINTSWELRTKDGGTLINFNSENTFGLTGGSADLAVSVPGMSAGPFTSARTISMDVFIRKSPGSGQGVSWATGNTGQHVLQVVVEPANIDPIKVWL